MDTIANCGCIENNSASSAYVAGSIYLSLPNDISTTCLSSRSSKAAAAVLYNVWGGETSSLGTFFSEKPIADPNREREGKGKGKGKREREKEQRKSRNGKTSKSKHRQ